MINYYGHDSPTIKQFDWVSTKSTWSYLFTSEPDSVCKEIEKNIILAKLNFHYMDNIIPKEIRAAESELIAIYTKDCGGRRTITNIDELTRQSILRIRDFFSKNHPSQHFSLCDESLFTTAVLDQDFSITPELASKPTFNGTHCYSEWAFKSIGIGRFFLPNTIFDIGTDDNRVSNHFTETTQKSMGIKNIPPVFFPKSSEVMKRTIHSDCEYNLLTWHLWRSKSSSFVQYGTAITDQLEEPKLSEDQIDCNHNLVPDDEEIERQNNFNNKECVSIHCVSESDVNLVIPQCFTCKSHDLDGNGIPDQCQDCNRNGVSDVNEIMENPDADRNHNGIIDYCEDYTSHISGTDCNYDQKDDGLQIFWNPELDKNNNSIIDLCEDVGVCSYNQKCMTSSRYKCEKFMGGVFHLTKCMYGTNITDGDDVTKGGKDHNTTKPENTNSTTEPIEEKYKGSCVISEKRCTDNILRENCDGDWVEDKKCSERRKIGKLEDNENLKHSIDTFSSSGTDNDRETAIFVAVLVCALLFVGLIFVTIELREKQRYPFG